MESNETCLRCKKVYPITDNMYAYGCSSEIETSSYYPEMFIRPGSGSRYDNNIMFLNGVKSYDDLSQFEWAKLDHECKCTCCKPQLMESVCDDCLLDLYTQGILRNKCAFCNAEHHPDLDC